MTKKTELKIVNKSELDEWLFNKAQIEGNTCVGIKGVINGETVNIAWKDSVTGEIIKVIHDTRKPEQS